MRDEAGAALCTQAGRAPGTVAKNTGSGVGKIIPRRTFGAITFTSRKVIVCRLRPVGPAPNSSASTMSGSRIEIRRHRLPILLETIRAQAVSSVTKFSGCARRARTEHGGFCCSPMKFNAASPYRPLLRLSKFFVQTDIALIAKPLGCGLRSARFLRRRRLLSRFLPACTSNIGRRSARLAQPRSIP